MKTKTNKQKTKQQPQTSLPPKSTPNIPPSKNKQNKTSKRFLLLKSK